MEASACGALIATAINVCGMRVFNELPTHTVLGTLLFTLGLAALADVGAKKYLPENLPYVVRAAVTILFSLYCFEIIQATFWVPLANARFELAKAVANWMSRCCNAGMGSAYCTLEQVASCLESALLPVVMGFMFLLGSLHGIQSPYVPFLWRPNKTQWRRLRPPTPFPSATDISQNTVDDHGEEMAELEQIFSQGSVTEWLTVQRRANDSRDEDMDEPEEISPRGSLSDSLKASLISIVKTVIGDNSDVDEDKDESESAAGDGNK